MSLSRLSLACTALLMPFAAHAAEPVTPAPEKPAEETFTAEQINAAAFDGAENRSITVKVAGGGERTTTGADYLMHFGWPNLHFHATTAYALLRHNGVPVGKGDYLGA